MSATLLSSIIKHAEVLLRLVLVVIAGSIIGLERELKGHSAGMRTHALVGLGAALFTLLSEQMFEPGTQGDHSRVIAGIAQGIGFLGAGAILKESDRVKGLTTAASIWFVGALGVAWGMGEYGLGILATISALIVLKPLKRLERSIKRTRSRTNVSVSDDDDDDD